MSKIKQIWTESYRPSTVDGYVFKDNRLREQVNAWIKEKSIPHILLSGGPGVGKSTLAKILINGLNVDKYDVLEINASRENGVDEVRNKITNFCSTMPFGDIKIVFLDEADGFSAAGQAALRGTMEQFATNVRFILTCNYPNKIIPALHSRTQSIHIDTIDQVEFTTRAATVLVTENIEFELDTLDTYVKSTYPDLRKCLNMLQHNSNNGKLQAPDSADMSTSDYKLSAVDLFKKGKIREARQLICSQARPEEMTDFFKWCYTNLDLWSKTDDGKDDAILIIRNGLVNSALVADQEINISAMLVELSNIEK